MARDRTDVQCGLCFCVEVVGALARGGACCVFQVDSLELKTNVVAAYVAAQLAHEIPDMMAAMKVGPDPDPDGRHQGLSGTRSKQPP